MARSLITRFHVLPHLKAVVVGGFSRKMHLVIPKSPEISRTYVACAKMQKTVLDPWTRLMATDEGKPTRRKPPRKHISFDELNELVSEGPIQLIDVRSVNDVNKSGGIYPGAIHIPHHEVKEALILPGDMFRRKYKAPKPKKDAIVVFCGGTSKYGRASAREARVLGYQNSLFYKGSFSKNERGKRVVQEEEEE